MPTPYSSRRGVAMLEFVLLTIPLLFALMSIFGMCLGMWQYHTIVEAVNYTTRRASVHGAGCAGHTCATTVGSTAQALAASALGMSSSQLNVTLASSASTVTCNPLSSCYQNSNPWPSLAGNAALTTQVSIVATYQFTSAISMWFPGHGVLNFNPVTLGAKAMAPVIY